MGAIEADTTRREVGNPAERSDHIRRRSVLSAIPRAIAAWILKTIRAVFGQDAVNRILLVSGRHTAFILRTLGAEVGEGERINTPLIMHNAQPDYRNLHIGDHCFIGKDVLLDLSNEILLEDLATVSMRVTIVTHMDVGARGPLRQIAYEPRFGDVRICRGAYIGAAATILHGVVIGECSVVAAGAVVTEDVPPYTVVAGVPARPVRMLDPNARVGDIWQREES